MAPLARPSALLAAALSLLAPRLASAQADPREPFEATGEVRLRLTGGQTASAAFNATRVVGPVVNVTRRDDGTWAGDLLGENLDLRSVEGKGQKVTGPNFLLVQSQSGETTEVEGLFNGVRFRATLTAKNITAKFGDCSMDLERRGGVYRGRVGCIVATSSMPRTSNAVMELMGEAGATKPAFPQLGIALVAILPAS
jgi:hypothetical protein